MVRELLESLWSSGGILQSIDLPREFVFTTSHRHSPWHHVRGLFHLVVLPDLDPEIVDDLKCAILHLFP